MKGAVSFFPSGIEPQDIIDSLLRLAAEPLWDEQVDVIERSTDGLKKSIARISEEDIRDELLAATSRIDTSLEEIKRLDEEVGRMRKLVGATKEYQDWRLLVSDVDRLKGEHVPKPVFDANVERLDEKIEKGLENLSKRVEERVKAVDTRIEDIKAIKFWSKRTLLEIALAIWGAIVTLIVALIGVGILKF